MISNLGRTLEESINKKVDSAKAGAEMKKAVEIAKNLLDVLSDDIISKKTGLPIDTIKKLREDAEKENLKNGDILKFEKQVLSLKR